MVEDVQGVQPKLGIASGSVLSKFGFVVSAVSPLSIFEVCKFTGPARPNGRESYVK